jgi:hypothetical protein
LFSYTAVVPTGVEDGRLFTVCLDCWIRIMGVKGIMVGDGVMSLHGMLGPRGGACGGATVPVAKVKVQLGRKFVASALAEGKGSLRLRLCR